MQTPFRLGRRQWYPFWFAAAICVAGAAFYLLPENRQTSELLLSLIGSVAALFHFLYSQHNTNTDRFVSLFREFNARFDGLNDKLNLIRSSDRNGVPDAAELQTLYDYFNLCSEEYLYYKAGYIDEDVWCAWRNGMRYFAEHDGIHRIWASELKQGSYYDFSLKLLSADASPSTQPSLHNVSRDGVNSFVVRR